MAETERRDQDDRDAANTTVNAYLRRDKTNTTRHRLSDQLRPHLILAGLWLTAGAGHLVALATGGATLVVTAVVAIALAPALGAYLMRRKRNRPVTGRQVAGVAAGTGWLAWVIAAGPSWTATAVLLAAGYAASLRWWRRWRIPDPPPEPPPPEGPGADHPPRLWADNIGHAGGKLPGSRLEHEEVIATGLRYLAPLVPGKHDLGDALAALPKLRTGLRLRRDQDLVLEHPDPERHPKADESVISVTIVRRSRILSDAVTWPGPTYDPAAGTIRLGPYVDGEGTGEWLVHADNGAWGGFLAGSIGSGKSRMLDSIALGLAVAGVAVWYGDPQGGASSPFLMQHADYRARTVAGIRDMLRMAQKVKRLRQAENALNAWEGWTPEQGRPGLGVIIDECHAALDDPECQRLAATLAREGRKVGIFVILADQVATLDAFGAGAGADALRSSVCSGNLLILRSKTYNTKNVLPGVDVDPTKFPRIPGYAYLIDDTGKRRSAPLRGYYLTDQARDEWGERITWPALDDGAAGAAGGGYRDRHHQAMVDQAALGEWVAAMREGREPTAEGAMATMPAEPRPAGGDGTDHPGFRLVPFPRWSDWQQQTQPAAAPAGPRTSVEVVYGLVAAGVSSPGELQARSGYSETGVRNALRQLAEAGRVRRDRHGVWTPTTRREETPAA